MRDLVYRYLNQSLNRREFIRSLGSCGFSAAATASILDSLTPLVLAETEGVPAGNNVLSGTVVQGTGGKLLVEQLRAAGVRFVFNCNSTRTYPIFDALVDRPEMQIIQIPQEGQMISVAQGYALASGQIAFTVNGSAGFPNTLNNMYNAWKDRTPLVSASQREPTSQHGGRDAFEEWDDFLGPSASFTRWRWSIDQARRIPEITRRAFKIASTSPEGPVTLAFPADLLAAGGGKASIVSREKFLIKPKVKPDPGLVEEAAKLLVASKNPLLLVGPEVSRSGAQSEVIKLAESISLPTTQGERLFSDFPNTHALYLGHYPPLMNNPGEVDVVLNLGCKMPYLEGVASPRAKIIHVSMDTDTIGRVVPVDLGMVADAKEAALDLTAAIESAVTRARLEEIRDERLAETRSYTESQRARRATAIQEQWNNNPLSWERVGGELNQLLGKDAIIVPELIQTGWPGYSENPVLDQMTFGPDAKMKIGRTTGAALGWGVGAAVGVKLAQPDRQVVALQGDGGFLFAQVETLWTMARYEVPVIVIILNNRSYNGPRDRILQAGGRQSQTGKDMTCYLGDPDVDFARVAAGFGVAGETVTDPDQFRPALRRAIHSAQEGKPYLIDAIVGRTGAAAESTWYPKYSVADGRKRKV